MTGFAKSPRAGVLLLAGCGVIFVAMAITVAWLGARATPRLPEEGTTHGGPWRRTAILLDVTDPLPPDQMAVLLGRLRQFSEREARVGEVVSLWVLGGGEDRLRRTFHRACPRRGGNPLTSNPGRQAARAESLFVGPLLRAAAASGGARPATESPLLESIEQLAVLGEFAPERMPGQLWVVSDLRQHTRRLSLYPAARVHGSLPAVDAPARSESGLRGASVRVLFISRPGDFLGEELELQAQWWVYFTNAGAGAVQFERL